MNNTITVYNDSRTLVATIEIDFEVGSVTLKNDKGHELITFTPDGTIVEHAGYHIHISNGDEP